MTESALPDAWALTETVAEGLFLKHNRAKLPGRTRDAELAWRRLDEVEKEAYRHVAEGCIDLALQGLAHDKGAS